MSAKDKIWHCTVVNMHAFIIHKHIETAHSVGDIESKKIWMRKINGLGVVKTCHYCNKLLLLHVYILLYEYLFTKNHHTFNDRLSVTVRWECLWSTNMTESSHADHARIIFSVRGWGGGGGVVFWRLKKILIQITNLLRFAKRNRCFYLCKLSVSKNPSSQPVQQQEYLVPIHL